MKTYSKERTLSWLNKQFNSGNISFDHKLQRPIGQWSPIMKSLLIHSLLVGIPVNPIYIVEENNILYPLDGSQRTSTCLSYIHEDFALSKKTPNVKLSFKVDGQLVTKEFIIAGKKFKKLDQEVQDALMSCGLDICTISEYTDDEIREMFRRQNSSKPLNNQLIRTSYESDTFSSYIFELSKHPFIDKIVTKAQRKNGMDRDLIIRTLMLIETNQEEEFLSFRKNDIDEFVIHYSDTIDKSKFDALKSTLDSFNESFKKIKMPATSIPMMLYCGYRVKKDKKSFTKFVEIINKFLSDYDTNEEYKNFVLQGTNSKEKVSGRFSYWKNLIKSI